MSPIWIELHVNLENNYVSFGKILWVTLYQALELQSSLVWKYSNQQDYTDTWDISVKTSRHWAGVGSGQEGRSSSHKKCFQVFKCPQSEGSCWAACGVNKHKGEVPAQRKITDPYLKQDAGHNSAYFHFRCWSLGSETSLWAVERVLVPRMVQLNGHPNYPTGRPPASQGHRCLMTDSGISDLWEVIHRPWCASFSSALLYWTIDNTCTVFSESGIPIVTRSASFALEPSGVAQAVAALAGHFVTVFKNQVWVWVATAVTFFTSASN